MICKNCGYCCCALSVIIVDDPEKGEVENNIKIKPSGKCQHLLGNKCGEYKCAIHDKPWYKKTPCFKHGQIEKSVNDNCRMGEYLLSERGEKVRNFLKL